MKNKEIKTKRQTKRGFRKLHARVKSTGRRRQRASTASSDMLDSDIPNASIARALTIILLLHVVAIGVIYIGIKWNKGDFDKVVAIGKISHSGAVDISNLNAKLDTKIAIAGDTYASFADRYGVNEQELRRVNGNAQIHAGKAIALPAVSVQSANSAVVTATSTADRPALATSATVVKVNTSGKSPTKPAAKPAIAKALIVSETPATYKVQSGDSVWRICHKFKIKQETLMSLNGMKDARHLRIGQVLKIPAK